MKIRMIIKNNFLLKFMMMVVMMVAINSSYAEIISTYSINSQTIKNLLPKIDKSSLVLINIDDTIIRPKSKMFNYGSPYRGFVDELSAAVKYTPKAGETIVRLLLQRQVVLIEEGWPNFINNLKNTKALVLGFTKLNPACRPIENFAQWQYQQLSNLGIKFTDKVNGKNMFKFDELNKNSSMFYQGIIFASTISKYAALEEFLKIVNISFDNIIFFDSKKSAIMDINNFLKTIDSDYYGVEYLAITNITNAPEKEVVQFQQQRLRKTGEWLEDETAKELIKK